MNSRFYREATFYSAGEVAATLTKAEFRVETICQTLIPGKTAATILEGHGQGSFVLIKAIKKERGVRSCRSLAALL